MPLLNLTQVPFGLFIPSLGVPELLVVLAIAVFMFGAKKLPEVAKGLGQGIREFKTSLKAEEKADEEKPVEQSTT
jgi:sec-independent protein translocase protein TatA